MWKTEWLPSSKTGWPSKPSKPSNIDLHLGFASVPGDVWGLILSRTVFVTLLRRIESSGCLELRLDPKPNSKYSQQQNKVYQWTYYLISTSTLFIHYEKLWNNTSWHPRILPRHRTYLPYLFTVPFHVTLPIHFSYSLFHVTLHLGFASVAGDVWGTMFRGLGRLTFEV